MGSSGEDPYCRALLRQELIRDEGLRYAPYRDSLGYWTIGVGHLIRGDETFSKPISHTRVLEILERDILAAECTLDKLCPAWIELDDVRQRALLNLAFNLGGKLGKFKNFLKAVAKSDWNQAAIQLENSLWYRQVKSRGPRIVHAIKTGTPWDGD